MWTPTERSHHGCARCGPSSIPAQAGRSVPEKPTHSPTSGPAAHLGEVQAGEVTQAGEVVESLGLHARSNARDVESVRLDSI
jgi:hypothetical protein